MPFNDELKFEEALVNLLTTNCGWEKEVIKYPTEEDLIKNWAQILFDSNKERDVLNNCPLTESEMNQIITEVNHKKTPLALNNFINGKTVSITRDNPEDKIHFGKKVSLKIYDKMEIAGGKSRYQIAEQPKFKTNNSVYPTRRGDIMLLINGMPLFHIELKKTGVPITHAEVQIEKYMNNGVFTGIFSLVQIFVAMNPEDAVYFANPGASGKFNPDFYFHWQDFNNEIVKDWKTFASDLLSIPMAHEMVGFYTIPDDSDGILKVMRSYQYFAASAISAKVAQTSWTKADQHGGYVWHTTGSGKTMTSFKAAQLIAQSNDADKVIFLLDRVELGDQSLINYRNFANVTESIQATEDTQELISKLKSDSQANTLIVTSLQKMSRIKEDGLVSYADLDIIKSKHIVFIIDECHRDQNGDMHQDIKRTFPNAIYFGFTGTPDHDKTVDIFGDELHRYTIVHGIRDNNVLGFDPYKVLTYKDNDWREKIGLEKAHAKTITEAMSNPTKKEVFLYYMNKGKKKCPMTEIENEIPKSQYETEKHEKAVVEDILSNWEIRSVSTKFHAIFATSSIPEAIKYYKLLKKQIEDQSLNLKITAIFDPSDNNNSGSIEKMDGITEILHDYEKMFGNRYDIGGYANFKKDACARLAHKKPYLNIEEKDVISIVIVVDQLLTGFDSKWINTLYLDKVLQGKNFIQAISRTNRLYGPDKPHGIVVWYRYPHTMDVLLQEAVESYSGNVPLGIFVNKLDKNLEQMNTKYLEIKDLFESVGIMNYEKNYDDDSWKKKFAKLFSEFNRYLNSAKIQGFVWKIDTYEFPQEDGTVKTIRMLLDENTYLILVQRYKELFKKKVGPTDVPYDIDTYITEIQTDTIDDAYMNSKFKLYIKNLSAGDEVAKEKALQELHKSFAALTQEEQKLAKLFLTDVQSGNIKLDSTKTFRDYITDYQCKAHNDQIHKLAIGLGVDEDKLRNLMNLHVTDSTINEYGRFDELKATLDIQKAKDFFEKRESKTLTKRQAYTMADDELRRFIIEGGFEI
ncbi:MAG: HsdR family type I site-specific deoxyribonuclease [Candidatus Izemoplasmatales bacterium]|nr:HsdR family type I site-specific deoxyribonuclease [Candidatus Izemoplasmatales bacterium]